MIASLSTARPYRRASSPLFAGFLITLALSLLLFTAPEAFSASTTLSWDAPTTNTDGSPLNDLAGYKVYYGTAPGSYSPPVTVGNVTSYTISGLSGGTYYFTVTAYDTAGNESSYSNEVSKSFTSQYTLTVSKTGTGTGTVTGTGISCGSDCSETYASGTIVTLTASAASGSQFGGWSGGGCSGTGQCVTTMTAGKTVTASFTSSSSTSYTITASAGTGGSISPSGSVSVGSGASKSFTITPSAGYQIADVKVDGSSVGAVSSYTFTNVTANRSISASFSAVSSSATVYEDAEDGTTKGWDIFDNSPSGATIKNVYDLARSGRVIKVTGSGTSNAYRLRNSDLSSWSNTSQFVAEWSMRYAEDFSVSLDVDTSAGHRYLTYTPSPSSSPSTGEYVYNSLGSSSKDGKWHTYTRDLQADLSAAQPGVTIQKVNGFIIRGSGKVDDIKLKSK